MIKRWDCQIEWSNDGTRRVINDFECDDGRYVTYWDASLIEAERAKLQSERDALAAEVEGLRARSEASEAMARKLLWLAYSWNDHNYGAAHVEARIEAQKQGIFNLIQANAWLSKRPESKCECGDHDCLRGSQSFSESAARTTGGEGHE